jgi:hypothetical protein
MSVKVTCFLFFISLVIVSQTTSASTIFSDNFDSENLGLNYTSFANWTVSDGSVDLIGQPNFFNFIPGNGRYVDLDGSSGNAGKLTSTLLTLTGGQDYVLSFDLAGSHRPGTNNTVTYGIDIDGNGSLDFSNSQTLTRNSPFSVFNLAFTVSASTSNAKIVFDHAGGDNRGLLLDNVALDTSSDIPQVPVPAAVWLFGSALFGFLAATRRKLAS